MEHADISRLRKGSKVYRMSNPKVEGTVIKIKAGKYIQVRWPLAVPFVDPAGLTEPSNFEISLYSFDHEGLLSEADIVMAALAM